MRHITPGFSRIGMEPCLRSGEHTRCALRPYSCFCDKTYVFIFQFESANAFGYLLRIFADIALPAIVDPNNSWAILNEVHDIPMLG